MARPEYDRHADGNVFVWILEAAKALREGKQETAIAARISRLVGENNQRTDKNKGQPE